jgi:hypothetical protein
MSQPSVSTPPSSFEQQASPFKRARHDKKQFIGPCYIRMQVLSFAFALVGMRLSFISPEDDRSVARGAKLILEQVRVKAEKKGLKMQSRQHTNFGTMGGACFLSLNAFNSVCSFFSRLLWFS